MIYWLIFMATEKWEIGDSKEGTRPVNLEVCLSSQQGVIFVHPGYVLASLRCGSKISNQVAKK